MAVLTRVFPFVLWWRGHLGRVANRAGKMPAPPGLIQSRTALELFEEREKAVADFFDLLPVTKARLTPIDDERNLVIKKAPLFWRDRFCQFIQPLARGVPVREPLVRASPDLYIDYYPRALIIFMGPGGTHVDAEKSKPPGLCLFFCQ